jgi:hypothetical protein
MPKVAADVRRQEKLVRSIASATAPHLGRKPLYFLAAGAWRSTGTYSAALTRALNKINDWVTRHNAYGSADTGGGNIDPNWPAALDRPSLDVYNFNADSVYLQNLPGTKTRVIRRLEAGELTGC